MVRYRCITLFFSIKYDKMYNILDKKNCDPPVNNQAHFHAKMSWPVLP